MSALYATATKKPYFYNTKEGDAAIASYRSKAASSDSTCTSSLHRDVNANKQRVYHSECTAPPFRGHSPTVAHYADYPSQEYNHYSVASQTWSGPNIHTSMRAPPTTSDIFTKYDMVANINAHRSIQNYNHGRPFVAKHTNNLITT